MAQIVVLVVMISSPKKPEDLSECNIRVQAILSHATEGIIIIDTHGSIDTLNPAAERMFGYEAEDMLGRSVLMLVPERDRRRYNRYIRNHLGRNRHDLLGRTYAMIGLHNDGSEFPIEIVISAIPLANRQLFLGTIQDITKRQEQEKAFQRSQERLECALRSGQIGFWDVDLTTGTVIVNEHWAEMLGYRLEELVPLSRDFWIMALHPDDREQILSQGRAYRDGEVPYYEVEYRVLTKDGQIRWQRSRGETVERDEYGCPIRMVGTVTDITEQKKK